MTRYLVTGGAGFIGSAIVKRLVSEGHSVRVLDDGSRGRSQRLEPVRASVEMLQADIRDSAAVLRAVDGVDSILHLAAVNGTSNFYTKPELVLDVGVRGMLNVLDAAKAHGIREIVLASSSEVYQVPPRIPTDEAVPLVIPDPHNPRYSYAGSKLISELLLLSAGRSSIPRVIVFRPHNVYGPDMGREHVIPEIILRLKVLAGPRRVQLSIQGTGDETRAFVYIDDLVEGVRRVMDQGEHLGIYNIGTQTEVKIRDLAMEIARLMGIDVDVIPGPLAAGSTPRRCPDLTKLQSLGYRPLVELKEGLSHTVKWYCAAD